MPIWKAIILGIVEGLTEFLPISSTGHLTFVEKLLDLPIGGKAVTGFTAVIQVGAIAAVVHYFRADIVRIVRGWLAGLRHRDRRDEFEYRFGWIVIVGSIPVGLVGLAARDLITGELRNLWWVAGALIAWSGVMVAAERVATQRRSETDTRLADAVFIGVLQCVSLIPGVSRSGATISAGLFRDLDRLAATRLSFFLAVPALVAAGAYELKDAVSSGVGWGATLVGTVISFVVAYATVVWLIRFVAHHPISRFAWYRVALGVLILALLTTGAMSPT